MINILVVDDQEAVIDSYRKVFEHAGCFITATDSPEEVMKIVAEKKPDIVLLDIDLKGDGKDRSGETVLIRLREKWDQKELPVIIISGTGDASTLIDLIQEKGANDYIDQPINDYQELLDMVKTMTRKKTAITSDETPEKWEAAIKGKSRLIMNLTRSVLRAAQNDCDTLILGETGTGKNLVAKIYHKLSQRHNKAFHVIHCPSISKELVASELFGYEGKTFTGSDPNGKPGKIDAANGGVVFLNEIGDLSLVHQAVILDFLDTKEITPVGSIQKKKLDVVVLAATNRDLKALVENGVFRKDLYYRLFSNTIMNPPLRDYLEDIPTLSRHFIKKANQELNKQVLGVDEQVTKRFQSIFWDGNVRQFEKCIHNGVFNCKGDTITWNDVKTFLEKEISSGPQVDQFDIDMKYEDFKAWLVNAQQDKEREYYSYHYKKHSKNLTQAAKAIGMARQFMDERLKKLGVEKK
jgi:DNA-binding NtrC family response regulator